MPHSPVPFVKELFIVATGALRETRKVEDFGGKTHGDVFPDGGVQALRTVLISVSLCLDPAEALDPVFERDEEGVPREEIPPGPGVVEGADGETVSKREDGEGKLPKWGPRRQKVRGQGGDASGSVGLRQVHTKLRRCGSVGKGWDRAGVLNRDKRREEELDPAVEPFRDLAGEGAWGGPEGLD